MFLDGLIVLLVGGMVFLVLILFCAALYAVCPKAFEWLWRDL